MGPAKRRLITDDGRDVFLGASAPLGRFASEPPLVAFGEVVLPHDEKLLRFSDFAKQSRSPKASGGRLASEASEGGALAPPREDRPSSSCRRHDEGRT